MKRVHSGLLLPIALLLLAGSAFRLVPAVAHAQSGDGPPASNATTGYEILWWTVDGGGITSASGGRYTLSGTAGQPDAGTRLSGRYVLVGGFWVGKAAAPYVIYLPLVLR